MDAVRNAIRAKKILHMDAFKAMIIKFITDKNVTVNSEGKILSVSHLNHI